MISNREILEELKEKLESELELVKSQSAYDDPDEGELAEYLFGKEHGLGRAISIVDTMLVYGTVDPPAIGASGDSSSEG